MPLQLWNFKMTEATEVKPKNKGGRPRKEKGGKNVWIPADLLDTVLLMIQATRQKQQRQQVQAS
jgi:hypothetical protein